MSTKTATKSRQNAINAMCRACIYDPDSGSGTWTQQVEDCTSPGCALYDFRPITRATRKERTDPAMAAKMRKLGEKGAYRAAK